MISDYFPYASLPEMRDWAEALMGGRAFDFSVGDDDNPYMLRWFVVPRNPGSNVYLHKILRSDDPRAMHDHPWRNRTYVIDGSYIEHTPEGSFLRKAGDIIEREATSLHRLEVIPGQQATTLFTTGPKVREWGFDCPKGWVHWEAFCAPGDKGRIGRGCGE